MLCISYLFECYQTETTQSSEPATKRKRKSEDQEKNTDLDIKKKKKNKSKNGQSLITKHDVSMQDVQVNEDKLLEVENKNRKQKRKKENGDNQNNNDKDENLSQSLIESEEAAKSMEKVGKTSKKKTKKAKASQNGLDDFNLTQDKSIDQVDKRPVDGKQHEKQNTLQNKKKTNSKSLQNDVLNNNVIENFHDQSQECEISKPNSPNVCEDDLDKALKEMREKISEKNAVIPTPVTNKQRNKRKLTPHAFATFTKSKTPPAYVKKTIPSTEPKKTKEIQVISFEFESLVVLFVNQKIILHI